MNAAYARIAFALVWTSVGVGCLTSEPSGISAARAASVVGPMVRQTDRLTTCSELTQPAILGIAGADKTPVWGCLPTCPANSEYVSNVVTWNEGERWDLEPDCQPVCPVDQHRTSYVDFDMKGHCSPGAVTDAAQVATFTRERALQFRTHEDEDRRARILLQKKEDEVKQGKALRRQADLIALGNMESDVHTLETTPAPWTLEQIMMQRQLAGRLRVLDDELLHHDSTIDLPTDAEWLIACFARIDALAEKRKQSELALGVRFLRHHNVTTRAMRVTACQHECAEVTTSCRATCSQLPAGACATCGQELAQCQDRCAAREAP